MEQLDKNHKTVPYLCGQLLTVLEEIQLRHSNWKINSTLVDRFYGAASTSPATVFGNLIGRATIDHLPKIRKDRLGYEQVEIPLEEVVAEIDKAGGFPSTLKVKEQAEFALGFYHKRAQYRSERLK